MQTSAPPKRARKRLRKRLTKHVKMIFDDICSIIVVNRVGLRFAAGGGRQEVVGRRWSAGGGRQEVVGRRWSAGGGRQEVVGRRWSAGGGRQEVVGRPSPTTITLYIHYTPVQPKHTINKHATIVQCTNMIHTL